MSPPGPYEIGRHKLIIVIIIIIYYYYRIIIVANDRWAYQGA